MQYCVFRFFPPGSLAAKVLDILVRVPCIIHSPPGFLLSIFNQRRNRDLQNHHFYNDYKVTISIQSNKRAVFVHILHWFQQQRWRYSFLNMVFIVNSKEFYFVTWIHSLHFFYKHGFLQCLKVCEITSDVDTRSLMKKQSLQRNC